MKLKLMMMASVLVLLLPLAGFAAGTAEEGAKPSVAVLEPVYEFDEVVDGSQVIHDFIVRNTGDAPLDITKVKPG
jgi:hypothetical protein